MEFGTWAHLLYHMFNFHPSNIKLWKERIAFVIASLFLGSAIVWWNPLVGYKVVQPNLNGMERHYAQHIVDHCSPLIPLEFMTELFSLEDKYLFLCFLYFFALWSYSYFLVQCYTKNKYKVTTLPQRDPLMKSNIYKASLRPPILQSTIEDQENVVREEEERIKDIGLPIHFPKAKVKRPTNHWSNSKVPQLQWCWSYEVPQMDEGEEYQFPNQNLLGFGVPISLTFLGILLIRNMTQLVTFKTIFPRGDWGKFVRSFMSS